MQDTDIIKSGTINTSHLISYIHQPYCWQVALRQSLLPLGADTLKIKKFFVLIKFVTNTEGKISLV